MAMENFRLTIFLYKMVIVAERLASGNIITINPMGIYGLQNLLAYLRLLRRVSSNFSILKTAFEGEKYVGEHLRGMPLAYPFIFEPTEEG